MLAVDYGDGVSPPQCLRMGSSVPKNGSFSSPQASSKIMQPPLGDAIRSPEDTSEQGAHGHTTVLSVSALAIGGVTDSDEACEEPRQFSKNKHLLLHQNVD